MGEKETKRNSKIVGAVIVGVIIGIVIAGSFGIGTSLRGNLTEENLETYFRNHTISGNYVVAMKVDFTIPQSRTAYLEGDRGRFSNSRGFWLF